MHTLIIYKPRGTSKSLYSLWQDTPDYLKKSSIALSKDRSLNPPGLEERLLTTEWIDHLGDIDFDNNLINGLAYIHWEE